MVSTNSERGAEALKAVDFFCGAGGMSFGLSQAGINVLGGVDNARDCKLTYEKNVPGAKFIRHDITRLSAPELGRRLGLERNDPNLVFCGCSPCQFWSKIRTDKTKSVKTAFLLKQFQRFIKYFRPGFVVVENVPGLYRRKDNDILRCFLEFLADQGYQFTDGVVNANHYGVPQNRMRYLLIASRLSEVKPMPASVTEGSFNVSDFIGTNNGFATIDAGHRDETDFQHSSASLSAKNIRRIAMTPASGGDRGAWSSDPELQLDAYRGRDTIFKDVYGRMSWDRPAPTITTRFISLSNGRFGHPEENRAISIREGATLQTFPKDYRFYSSNLNSLARQIGNAVPPALARKIGEHLIAVRNG
ncbi:MAG: DNA cytosine methyltransferase [Allorhizobium sp.]